MNSIGASRAAVERSLRQAENVTVIQGHARLVSEREIEVGTQRLRGKRIFLNLGGRPSVPSISGIEAVPYLTSDSIMEMDALPARLVVLGGSYVGLEFAQMFRRFGADVTVVEAAPRLVAREDAEISGCLREILEAEQIRVVLGASELSLVPRDGGFTLRFAGGEAAGTHLLMATGRRPNTGDLARLSANRPALVLCSREAQSRSERGVSEQNGAGNHEGADGR